jgi:signal transduction histidine kinase
VSIRLRSFVILSSLLVVGLVLVLSSSQMKKALERGALTLKQKELEHISQVVRSIVETKKSDLKNYTRVISNDNDLASTFIIASESGDTSLIEVKLEKIKEEVNLDFAEIVNSKGRMTRAGGSGLVAETVDAIHRQREGLIPSTLFGKAALVSFAPMKLYGEPIGIVAIGYLLEEHLGKELAKFTDADVDFNLVSSQSSNTLDAEHGKINFPLGVNRRERLVAQVRLKGNPAESFWNLLSSQFFITALLSLGLLLVVLYGFLELGFIRQFRNFVWEMDQTSRDVDRGEPRELSISSSYIAENNLLFRASQTLVHSLIAYQRRMKEQVLHEEESRKQAALGDLAQQVAHDIRSPLSALLVATDSISHLPEANRILIRGAITRIQDIANDLLSKRTRISSDTRSVQLLPSLLETAVSEKRIEQTRGRLGFEIEYQPGPSCYGLFVNVQPSVLKRVLCNLLDNSIEALVSTGRIVVSMLGSGNEIEITIEDSGKGIPEEVLPQLGQRGKTFNKVNGSGLGLYHARTTIEAWGGSLRLESKIGEGTRVRLFLPKVEPPSWFVPSIQVVNRQPIIVVDDDVSIHQIWAKRFSDAGIPIRKALIHFSHLEQLIKWRSEWKVKALHLVDYEFVGEHNNGLSVIESLHIADQSILVTSRNEDPEVIKRCLAADVKLVPKGMANLVPIEGRIHAV